MKYDVLYTANGAAGTHTPVYHFQVVADDRAGAIGLAHADLPPYSTLISVTEHDAQLN